MKAQLEVLDLLFPKTRADILRLIFFGKKRQCYVRELKWISPFLSRESSSPALC